MTLTQAQKKVVLVKDSESLPQEVLAILESLRPLLPNQAPLTSYIHNNILESFERYPYWEGMQRARDHYENSLAMPLDFYVKAYEDKRITNTDLKRTLERQHQRYPALNMRDLWRALFVKLLPKSVAVHRDTSLIELLNNLDFPTPRLRDPNSERDRGPLTALLVQLLCPLVDQGMNHWPSPDLALGIWAHADTFFKNHPKLPFWCRHLHEGLAVVKAEKSFEEVVVHYLQLRGVSAEGRYEAIAARLFEMKGWAGFISRMELAPHLAPVHAPQVKLLEFLALFLVLEHAFLKAHPFCELIYVDTKKQLIFYLSSLFLHRQWKTEDSAELLQWSQFYFYERERVWHEAYELRLRRDFCQNFLYDKTLGRPNPERANVYVTFCIDDREESLRRHLEARDLECKTFGVAGFYGVDMKFILGHHENPHQQCPAPLTPKYVLKEMVNGKKKELKAQKNTWGHLVMALFKGQLFAYLHGLWGFVPLITKVHFPRFWGLVSSRLNQEETKIDVHFKGETLHGLQVGYTTEEMAERVAVNLKLAGMAKDLPELVVILAHGSTSINNPYKNAYGCGACSGKNGGVNARAFCQMANDPEVRKLLAEKHQLAISEKTFFVAGQHNTSLDLVDYYDLALLPAELKTRFADFQQKMDLALKDNAMERCRRFHSVKKFTSKEKAHRYVFARANSIAEPRPEYGHTSNAFCIIGRRELTQNVFMDRRAFLVSYDPSVDPTNKNLEMALALSVPVCTGINLDYTLSKLDNENLGAGTKLPLNLVGLMGLMTGAGSDLRTCLPRQMVEWHEPNRLTFLLETSCAKALAAIEKLPRVSRILFNEWSRLLVYDPDTKELWLLYEKQFRKIELTRKKVIHKEDFWQAMEKDFSGQKGELPFFVLGKSVGGKA